MTYQYSKKSIIMEAIITSILIFIMIFGTTYSIQFTAGLLGFIIGKDTYKSYLMRYEFDAEGILERGGKKSTYVIRWEDVDLITTSRMNKNWVVVHSPKKFYTIKPLIMNHEQMVRDVVDRCKQEKKVVLNEVLITVYDLNVKLNNKGYLRK